VKVAVVLSSESKSQTRRFAYSFNIFPIKYINTTTTTAFNSYFQAAMTDSQPEGIKRLFQAEAEAQEIIENARQSTYHDIIILLQIIAYQRLLFLIQSV
jgi:hypothetical protein